MDPTSIVFDRYRLEERIGAGGMAVVWKATDLKLDQPVALKRISLAGMDTEQAKLTKERALREAQTAARLRGHRHVVATYDVYLDSEDIWLVLEYLPARTLGALCRERGRLEILEVARIGAAVADALAAGHAQEIVHRDVTPANVLIADDGTVKLTDFGISRITGADPITREGIISGTTAYLAPEVARTCEYTPASDVFSLGATLYAAIEGQPPFGTDDNALRLLNVIRTGIIRKPTSTGALASLLLRLLELNPTTRPDAATTRDLLSQFAHRLTTPTEYLPPTDHPTPSNTPPTPAETQTPPPPEQPPTWRHWPRRHRVLAAALALLTLTGIGLGTAFGITSLTGNSPTGTSQAALVGAPPLPATVKPIALTGDPKAADPCALIDLAWLHQFGNPRFVTPQLISDCAVRITTPNGDNATLDVVYRLAVPSVAKVGGQAQRLGALTILRKQVLRSPWATYCQNMVVLDDNTPVEIDAFGGEGFDVCKLAEVGTATAVNALADHGITYSPGRTAARPITRTDACTVLTDPELSTLGGVDPAIRTPGYANWLCQWGPPIAFVQVWFRLDSANIGPNNYGNPTTIADRRAWLKPVTYVNPHQCIATVVSHTAQSPTDATEMIQVTTQAAVSDQTLCTRASDLAARAVTRVPTT